MDIRLSVKLFLFKVECLRVVVELVLGDLLFISFTNYNIQKSEGETVFLLLK
jgi:hypothetical protein